MRTARTIALVVLIVAVGTTMGFAKAPKSAITNSAHDLRASLTGASFTVCNFCHVAHKPGATPAGPGPLLWNHTQSSVTTYGVYASDTFNQLGTDITDLGTTGGGSGTTASNLCLSCHDGTIAVDSWYVPVTGSTFAPLPGGTLFMPSDTTIKDLTKTHPVNFTYNTALATAAGILSPANTLSVDGAGEIPLFAGKMQCATCHDPHNGKSSIFEQNFPVQASGSFCTYCHL